VGRGERQGSLEQADRRVEVLLLAGAGKAHAEAGAQTDEARRKVRRGARGEFDSLLARSDRLFQVLRVSCPGVPVAQCGGQVGEVAWRVR
jgi:hypothetical protein